MFNLIGVVLDFFYRRLKRIPILGTILKISNTYVYAGDFRSLDSVAPMWRWCKLILLPFFVAFLIAAGVLYGSYTFPGMEKYKFDWNGSGALIVETWTPVFSDLSEPFDKPGQIVTSIFPNLLGFGIGVYALVFALAPRSLQLLQSQLEGEFAAGTRKEGHALMLNASLAYPLLVITLSLVPGIFQQLNPKSLTLAWVTWIVFWYGVVVLIELLGVLFALGEQDGMDKIYP